MKNASAVWKKPSPRGDVTVIVMDVWIKKKKLWKWSHSEGMKGKCVIEQNRCITVFLFILTSSVILNHRHI